MSSNSTTVAETTSLASQKLSGHWKPRLNVKDLYYGAGCVQRHLLDSLPTPASKAFIVTGKSLSTKTPLVGELQALLGSRHAGTTSTIRQHGPIADVDQAVEAILAEQDVDTIISLGGGSPIDTAKVVSYRAKEARGHFLTHLTIPTTLSAAECTAGGGYTREDGTKMGFRDPGMGVSAIFYDPAFARYTPTELWLSTGLRALDHAVECMYHPTSTEVPWKALALWAAGELFDALPRAKETHPHDENTMVRLMLAAYASSGLKGENIPGGMGLSHSLGHALGSPYGIPHGITSCMTLGKVVKLKARQSPESASQAARLLPAAGGQRTGDDVQDSLQVGDRIIALVDALGLSAGSLSSYGVDAAQIPIISQRALGGVGEGPQLEQVSTLVASLF